MSSVVKLLRTGDRIIRIWCGGEKLPVAEEETLIIFDVFCVPTPDYEPPPASTKRSCSGDIIGQDLHGEHFRLNIRSSMDRYWALTSGKMPIEELGNSDWRKFVHCLKTSFRVERKYEFRIVREPLMVATLEIELCFFVQTPTGELVVG